MSAVEAHSSMPVPESDISTSETARLVTSIVQNHEAATNERRLHYGILPTHQQDRLEDVLGGIQRGRKLHPRIQINEGIPGDDKGIDMVTSFLPRVLMPPENPLHQESVLQHSNSMLEMVLDLQTQSMNAASNGGEEYRGLFHALDWTTIANIIPVHDIGEGWEGGDLPRLLGSLYYTFRSPYQRGEEGFVAGVIIPGFDDQRQKDWFTQTYERYENKKPNDLEAQVVNMMDKLQSQVFISAHNITQPFEVRAGALEAGLRAMYTVAAQLETTNPNAVGELYNYVRGVLQEIKYPALTYIADRLATGREEATSLTSNRVIQLADYKRRGREEVATQTTPHEIERRWVPQLHPAMLDMLKSYPHTQVTQWHFFNSNGTETRLRQEDNKLYLSQRAGDNLHRVPLGLMVEAVGDEVLFTGDIVGSPIQKTRYHLEASSGSPLALDVYHGNLEGLVLLEGKFESQEQADAFIPREFYGHEVSTDDRFSSPRLASDGIPANI